VNHLPDLSIRIGKAVAKVAVSIIDEVPGQGRHVAFTLNLSSERVTARELIERRVRHEVGTYNHQPLDTFSGLVQPTDSERVLNGWRLRQRRRIDPEEQVTSAWQAFTAGRILLLVDDRQVEALDDPLTLPHGAEVCFYKLVPLVGG
jgi:hypothetical protein